MRRSILTLALVACLASLSCSSDRVVSPETTDASFHGHPLQGAYDQPPAPLVRVKPTYPEFAREAQIEGTVVIQIEVSPGGIVTDVILKREEEGLNGAAIYAATQWMFRPATSGGTPVTSWYEIVFLFALSS